MNFLKLAWSLMPKWATDFITGLVWAAAAIALLLVVLKVGEYQGRAEARAACQADANNQEIAKLKKANADYDAEVKAGNAQVEALSNERNQLASQRDELQRRLKHVPQTVATTQCPDPGAVHLTLGAVRLWNSDLGYPELPAGACGAAGGPAGAEAADGVCASDSGIGLEQARDNVQDNYRASSAIRAQCQALIDNLKRRQARQSVQPAGEAKP